MNLSDLAAPEAPRPNGLLSGGGFAHGLDAQTDIAERHARLAKQAAAEGVVDYVDLPTFLGVRTDDAMYRFIHSGPDRGNVVVLGHHVFAEAADEKETELAWQTWLNALSF